MPGSSLLAGLGVPPLGTEAPANCRRSEPEHMTLRHTVCVWPGHHLRQQGLSSHPHCGLPGQLRCPMEMVELGGVTVWSPRRAVLHPPPSSGLALLLS